MQIGGEMERKWNKEKLVESLFGTSIGNTSFE
jgi:hypothetical protein